MLYANGIWNSFIQICLFYNKMIIFILDRFLKYLIYKYEYLYLIDNILHFIIWENVAF